MALKELIIIGDRVLISPRDGERQTASGLYLPASVAEKEQVGSGQVVRVGPGYLMPNPEFNESESWASREAVRYLPLQAHAGDYALYLRKEAFEIEYEEETYLIVPHSAILVLIRPSVDDILDAVDNTLDDLID